MQGTKNEQEKMLHNLHCSCTISIYTDLQPVQVLFICLKNLAKSRNYPILFGYFGDLAKFSRILHEQKIYLNIVILFYIWQWLAYCFDQTIELNIAKFLQKNTSAKILYFHEVSEKIWLSPRSIQKESDSSGTQPNFLNE